MGESEKGRDAAADAAVLKAWLIRRRKEEGLTLDGLAGYLGVDRKTITTAFSPSKGFPNGLTTFQLISELGGIALNGPDQKESMADKLDRIEAVVSRRLTNAEARAEAAERANAELLKRLEEANAEQAKIRDAQRKPTELGKPGSQTRQNG